VPYDVGTVSGDVVVSGRYDPGDARATALGVRAAGDPDDPAGWPADPLR
jgi:hypothetical protein